MGKRGWWQRSLDGSFRLLGSKFAQAGDQRRRIEEKQDKALVIANGTVTYVDGIRRKRIAKDLAWRAKWDNRTARFNASEKRDS